MPDRDLPRTIPSKVDDGFSLIETVIALALLATVITFMSGGFLASAAATAGAQARLNAQELAARALQQVKSLGYESASEGIECTSISCNSLQYSDPNAHISKGSDGCFYLGAQASGLLIPTQYNPASASSDVPIVPNVSQVNSALYPSPKVDGVTFTVTVYPFFDEKAYATASPAVTCSSVTNGSASDIPLTVLAEVAWGANGAQHTSLSTILYAVPPPSTSAGNCPTPAAEQGAHDEQLMGNQEVNGALGSVASVGDTLSVMFIDEQPTPYSPAFCVVDSSGNTVELQPSQLPGYSVTQFGTSSSQPYFSDTVTPAQPGWQAGSGPNAANPPAGGTYCTSSKCSAEVLYSFQLPASDGLASISSGSSITLAIWDHEGDLSFVTWTVR